MARLEERQFLARLELAAFPAACIAVFLGTLAYLAKWIAAAVAAAFAAQSGERIEVFLENGVVAEERHAWPHLLYLLVAHRAAQRLGRLAYRFGIAEACAAIEAAISYKVIA